MVPTSPRPTSGAKSFFAIGTKSASTIVNRPLANVAIAVARAALA